MNQTVVINEAQQIAALAERLGNLEQVILNRSSIEAKVAQLLERLTENNGEDGPKTSLMNDDWIRRQCMFQSNGKWFYKSPEESMIYPFQSSLISKGVVDDTPMSPIERKISFGLSSFGYDATLAPKFKLFTPIPKDGGPLTIIDPKKFDPRCFIEVEGDSIILPPSSFMLAVTNEYFRMPRDAVAICFNKSTYARCGINVTTTIMEPGWHGQIVLEIANTTPIPAKIYANEGIAQLVFLRGASPLTDYSDRDGKYQGQTGIQTPL